MGVFILIGIIIVAVIISAKMNSPEAKGKRGENKTAAKLKAVNSNILGIKTSESRDAILRNVYVPKEAGGTSEIDLLYITAKGIFVIENKNYIGYIFGNDRYKNWTVTLYTGKDFFGNKHTEKIHFYNPIWQNRTHIRNLRKFLKEEIPMFSIIVFGDRCELMSIDCPEDTTVCQQYELKWVIKQISSTVPDVLSSEKIEQLRLRLEKLTELSDEEKAVHVSRIQEQMNSTEKCPRCGGYLVLRTAHQGANAGKQFYGCASYPKCKYTRNME